jgi:hypothetical protein
MMQIGVKDIKNTLMIMMLKKSLKNHKYDKIPFHSPLGGNN